ncbi:hypothetical protein KIH87_08325 [Paraneptunicella aestuarii]|uniref:hypothetical protein n=1 Tax=Paraneptunicella aestuarii TaxID=2831148 RepID=UPI001E5543A2|nr:hypothetical protein [Paraneptunicella aestuarii]UAA40326.1 hypothetical protein KIH87_08325 [Paraneptunicella aestuarii]
MVEHSKIVKLLAYTCGVLLIPAFLGGAVAIPYIMLTNDVKYELWPLVFLTFLSIGIAIYFIRNFYLLVRFIGTINHKFEFDENGITMLRDSQAFHLKWEALKRSKEYKDCQIFCLVDESGKHLISVWEYASNYSYFREMAKEKLGI